MRVRVSDALLAHANSGVQLEAIHYPAWTNHPCASCLVSAARASAMACSKVSSVRAALARRLALIFDHHASLGDKSGAYGGRERSRTPAAAQAAATPAPYGL